MTTGTKSVQALEQTYLPVSQNTHMKAQDKKTPQLTPYYDKIKRIQEKCSPENRSAKLQAIREKAVKAVAHACENYIPDSERFEEVPGEQKKAEETELLVTIQNPSKVALNTIQEQPINQQNSVVVEQLEQVVDFSHEIQEPLKDHKQGISIAKAAAVGLVTFGFLATLTATVLPKNWLRF